MGKINECLKSLKEAEESFRLINTSKDLDTYPEDELKSIIDGMKFWEARELGYNYKDILSTIRSSAGGHEGVFVKDSEKEVYFFKDDNGLWKITHDISSNKYSLERILEGEISQYFHPSNFKIEDLEKKWGKIEESRVNESSLDSDAIWEHWLKIKDSLGTDKLLDELINYLDYDTFADFIETVERNYDLDVIDESVKQKYEYHGSYTFDGVSNDTKKSTHAVSNAEAVRNIKIQILKDLGVPYNRINDLYIEETSVVPVEDIDEVPDEHPVCPECGTRLTDGGYCPICDDGEEDYY